MPRLKNGLYRNTPDGEWHYHFRLNRKPLKGSTGRKNLSEARVWLDAYKTKLKDQAKGMAAPDVPTLRKIWKEWDTLKASSVSASHRRWMGNCMGHAGEWLDRPACDLDTAAVAKLQAAYLESTGKGYRKGGGHAVRSHSEGGWNKVLTQWKALLNWAVKMGHLQCFPFGASKLKPSPKAKGVLWPEQVKVFLEAVDKIRKERKGDPFPHAGILCRLMLGLGLRESEARHAEWERIDWRRKVFIVAESSEGQTVKDRAIREIPIPAWLERYLLLWWSHHGNRTQGLLMVARNGKAHGEGATGAAVARGAAALKIENLTPHGLRRTFATGHFEAGTPLSQIQQMMGHEDPILTFKRYIIQRPKDQAKSQEKLARAMGL